MNPHFRQKLVRNLTGGDSEQDAFLKKAMFLGEDTSSQGSTGKRHQAFWVLFFPGQNRLFQDRDWCLLR